MDFKHLEIAPEPYLSPVVNVPTRTQDENDFEAMTPLEGEGNDAFKTEHDEGPISQFWEFQSLTGEEVEDQLHAEKAKELAEMASKIANEGLIDRFQAQAIDKYVPDFYFDHGGGSRFTYTPSLEGVTYALEAIDQAVRDNIRASFKKVAEWAVSLYNRLAELINKFVERMKGAGQVGNDNLISQLNEKNAKSFADAEKTVSFIDEATADADKVIALLLSGLREAVQDENAEQESSIERAGEVFKTQFEKLTARVDDFKKALGNSPYGKKLMGQIDDAGTPTLESIQSAAEGIKKIAAAMTALQSINSPEELTARMEELAAVQQEYKDALQDNANKGETVGSDLSKHKLKDLYSQTKQFTETDKSSVDMAAVKTALATVTSVRDSIKNTSAAITRFGERIGGMEGIDQNTVSNAQSVLQSSAAMIGKLVASVINATDAMSGSTQGKVWVISQFVKLINMVPTIISSGCGPLSEAATASVKENALRHFGIQMGTSPAAKPASGGSAGDSFL